jgi:hypothetical protein
MARSTAAKQKTRKNKARDSRVRRWARRLGLTIQKSRTRRLHYEDLGLYMLMLTQGDPNSVLAGDRYSADLDDLEDYLRDEEHRLSEKPAYG